MSVQTIPYSRPEEITEYFIDDLNASAGLLGIAYVGGYGDKMIPEYPAIIVTAGDVDKEVHGTHTYLVTIRCFLFVYHASMALTHASRSLADLELATGIVDFVERDPTLGGKIIHGYINEEVPGAAQLNANRSDVVVSTRLGWQGISERRF